jgi:hypothetical protein
VRRAALYDLGNCLFVHAYVLSEAGFWVAAEPSATLGLEGTDEDIGSALQGMLARDVRVGARPRRDGYHDIGDPVLKVAGLSSWTELQRRGRMCDVEQPQEKVRLIPTRNERR